MSKHITWNDQGQPISTLFDDVYFSTEDGLAESRYVFLEHNHLAQRFQSLQKNNHFTISETGFGTGLNFLATCELWERCTSNNPQFEGTQLHFISVEKFPLDSHSIKRALALWPNLASYSERLLAIYPPIIKGIHRLNITASITLTLIFDDADTGLAQLISHSHPALSAHTARQWHGVDAWFLDGFTPTKNPEMWSDALFTVIAKLSHSSTTLATFTAAGIVRRGLAAVGFKIQKASGFGKKREMVLATFCENTYQQTCTNHQQKNTTPWAIIDNHNNSKLNGNKHFAIIGGGIAGCHSAYALAKRGYQVTLFERDNQLASGASGNQQGIVYAKLSPSQEPPGEFNLYSLLYAQQCYRDYWQQHKHTPEAGQSCGVLQLSMDGKTDPAHQQIAQRLSPTNKSVTNNGIRYLSATQASAIADTTLNYSALFLPDSGWIHPQQLCRWLSQHPNITVIPNTTIDALEQSNHQWHITYAIPTEKALAFDGVIIANAYDALQFQQTKHLPIKQIRGQVTHVPCSPQSRQLKTVICGKGYIAPATHYHCLGATFNLGVSNTKLNADDHLHNLQTMATQTPDLINNTLFNNETLCKTLSGRVGFRCTTPDYLPIVGAAPVADTILQQYQGLSKDAKAVIDTVGSYYPNLYLNIGHGSRGLAYTPLCSEILASLINGDPPPIQQSLVQKLNPARFLIRQLIRS